MSRPVLTASLVAANVAAYAVHVSPWTYGLTPLHPTVSSMLTGMFVHASLVHLVGNMAFLLVLGAIVEPAIGRLNFLALYLAAGVGGAFVHVLVNPTSRDVLVGASGAVCGLLAVAAVLHPRLLGLVFVFALLNVWYAGVSNVVSFGAHIGGLAVGTLFALVAGARGGDCLEAT
jgi:membrane associated rhomboid family serine protease